MDYVLIKLWKFRKLVEGSEKSSIKVNQRMLDLLDWIYYKTMLIVVLM